MQEAGVSIKAIEAAAAAKGRVAPPEQVRSRETRGGTEPPDDADEEAGASSGDACAHDQVGEGGEGRARGPPARPPFVLDPKRYYTPAEWAELSGYSTSSLATFRSKRKYFNFIRLGGRVFYKGSDLIAALERHQCRIPEARP